MLKFVLGIGLALLLVSGQGSATILTGGASGLAAPSNIITFDELGNLQNQTITTEFAGYGASFVNFGWDNSLNGQTGCTGFAGGDLVNGFSPFPTGSLMTISFTQAVTDAAFAAVDQGGTFTLTSFVGGSGGTPIETFNLTIPLNPGIGFIGFTNSFFDTITMSATSSSALSIDTLEMNVVPEPGVLTLLGGGLVLIGCLAVRRRRNV